MRHDAAPAFLFRKTLSVYSVRVRSARSCGNWGKGYTSGISGREIEKSIQNNRIRLFCIDFIPKSGYSIDNMVVFMSLEGSEKDVCRYLKGEKEGDGVDNRGVVSKKRCTVRDY